MIHQEIVLKDVKSSKWWRNCYEECSNSEGIGRPTPTCRAQVHVPDLQPYKSLMRTPAKIQGRTEPKGQPFLPLSQRLKKLSWCVLQQTTPRLPIPTAFRDSRIDCLTPRQILQLQILTLARIQRLSTTRNSRTHPAKWLLVPSSLPGESHAATTLKARARAWSSMLLVELAVSLV